MDERRALDLISELQERIRELEQENQNYASAVVNYEEFLKKVPRLIVQETGTKQVKPEQWLDWAKKELCQNKQN